MTEPEPEPVPTTMPEAFHGLLPPYPQRRLTEEESLLLLKLGQIETEPEEKQRKLEQELHGASGFQILSRRLRAYRVPVTFATRVFATLPCKGAGHCVVMAWTLAAVRAQLRRPEPLGLTDLIMHAFSDGMPDLEDQKAWEACWESQKFGSMNLIDRLPWPGASSPG